MGQKVSGGIRTPFQNSLVPGASDDLRWGILEPQCPARLDILLDEPPADHEEQLNHAWNPADRSLNLFIKDEDEFTVHRHPVAQSTDAIRGKVCFTRGLHVWEIHWSNRLRGTHAVVGVATAKAPLHANGYHGLIGSNAESWG